MTERDFVYWIQGFFELSDAKTLNEKQTDLIRRHLNMVFFHAIDPSMGDEDHQKKLTDIHHPKPTVEDLKKVYDEIEKTRHRDIPWDGLPIKINC